MKKFLEKSQKIKATCIVKHDDKILLLRGDQVVNREHRPRAGYFGIPSFTVPFSKDPEDIARQSLQDYFSQTIEDLSIVDVYQYLSENDSEQIFEIVYSATCNPGTQLESNTDVFFFSTEEELDNYMFPEEIKELRKYLDL